MDSRLRKLLYTFLMWHPARIKTFVEIIFAVIKSRTVVIKDIAVHVKAKGNLHSKIRKVERLFLNQHFEFEEISKIILSLLSLKEGIIIAIDRTNWKFGNKNLNFFVAAIIYQNISIPIACLLLDKQGNSSTYERKLLIEKVLGIIPKNKIMVMLADREFIGDDWLKYLSENDIPFAIRIKKSEQIRHYNGGEMKLCKFFSNMMINQSYSQKTRIYSGIEINLTCLNLKNEQLFIVSNIFIGQEALWAYKKRWGIERTFKSIKSSGFNIEDTHIVDLKKLEKLFAIVSLALTICVIVGDIKNTIIPIKNKNHGRKVYSLFTYGFDFLKEYFNDKKDKNIKKISAILKKLILEAT